MSAPHLEAEEGIREPTAREVFLFMIALSTICAVILSLLAILLAKPKEVAKELDRSKQLLIAAHVMNHEGQFLLPTGKDSYSPATYVSNGSVALAPEAPTAAPSQILEIYAQRVVPLLTDDRGQLVTFKEAGLEQEDYLAAHQKIGYYQQPYRLLYEILPNGAKKGDKPIAYVIPVNGFGLWDAIYGYLAIAPDGNTVIGTTWYQQKETPGLGANIADPNWQSLFPGKKLFLSSPDGTTDFATAPVGLSVIKGKVSELLANSVKAQNAVDGMAGATLTGNGVMQAYKDVLTAYRPFLLKLHQEFTTSEVKHG